MQNKIIIGCDPDVDGKGFAIYEDGELFLLKTFSLIELQAFIKSEMQFPIERIIELHIEDVNGNKSSSFNHRSRQTKQVQNKISESVGRCKQMQLEVEKVSEYFDIKIVRYPVSNKWKDNAGKAEFELITGWKGRSNEDNRSAAYFGYLGVLANK